MLLIHTSKPNTSRQEQGILPCSDANLYFIWAVGEKGT